MTPFALFQSLYMGKLSLSHCQPQLQQQSHLSDAVACYFVQHLLQHSLCLQLSGKSADAGKRKHALGGGWGSQQASQFNSHNLNEDRAVQKEDNEFYDVNEMS